MNALPAAIKKCVSQKSCCLDVSTFEPARMVMNDVYCDGGFSVEYSLGKNNELVS